MAAEPDKPDPTATSWETSPPRRKSATLDFLVRKWIWVFVVLAVLGILAVAINFGYNIRQQLTPAQLHEARQRWEQHGPADYDLRVQIRRHTSDAGDPAIVDNYVLQVRDRQVVHATINDGPLEPQKYEYYDMPGLYDSIDEFLRRDQRDGRRESFMVAKFDRRDGRLMKFIRRVRNSNERQEIIVALERR